MILFLLKIVINRHEMHTPKIDRAFLNKTGRNTLRNLFQHSVRYYLRW